MSWRVRHTPDKPGFTLVEVLVASTLALLVLTLTVRLLFPALRAWSDGQKRSEVSQSVLITSGWLDDDVTQAAPNSIALTPEGSLIMRCARGQTVDHTNPFLKLVAYWQEQGHLYRTVQQLNESEGEIPATTLAALRAAPDRRRVASGVTRFEIELNPETPWLVGLAFEVDKEGRKAAILTSFCSIYAPVDRENLGP